jgi:pimeloyl-ACP methyl ester carboxylesterase
MTTKQISIPITQYAIEADWHQGKTERDIIIVFVGFGSNKKRNNDFIAKVAVNTGFSALVVDFSGHGESPFDVNDTVPAQHVLEATKAYDWVAAHYPGSRIHVIGTSYGGFIAAYLSKFRMIQKLILRTPAIYEPKDFYTEHRHINKIFVRTTYRKDTEQLAKHPLFLQTPLTTTSTLLIVHGEDKSVPTETTDTYATFFESETYVAEGFAHPFSDPANPSEGIAKYYEAITGWLSK